MTWQGDLQTAFRSPPELLEFLQLEGLNYSEKASELFSMLVPKSFANRMQKGNPNCPLLKQVLPIKNELQPLPGFSRDPLIEKDASPSKGVLHKYQSRVLLIFTGTCAINCRYCFRRHYPYASGLASSKQLAEILQYLQSQPKVNEVILSGGDPLLSSNQRLEQLILELEKISHIKTVRLHSRLPIVLPSRIEKPFIRLFQNSRLQSVMVMHSNHPNELNQEVKEACLMLNEGFDLVLNQSVLLQGVNDCPDVLSKLSFRLFEFGVMPYYLHQLDKVEGAEPFYLEESHARRVYQSLQTLVPGYLLPRWVVEEPDKAHKTLKL